MKKKGVQRIGSIILCAALIAGSSAPAASEVFAEENQIVNTEGRETEFITEPTGGVEPGEAIPISEEEAEQLHEIFAEEKGIGTYVEPPVGSGFVSEYGYNALQTETEQACYIALKNAACTFHASNASATQRMVGSNIRYVWGEIQVKEYNLTIEQIADVMFAVEADVPEFFWFDASYSYSYDKVTGIVTNLYPNVETEYIDGTVRKSTQKIVEEGMAPYLEAIDNAKAAGTSDMAMELLIHDMIVEAVDYEYIEGTTTPQSAAYAHSIVGVFDKSGVVCEGYSKAFQLLMNYAGIESIYAVGYGNGGGHAWNLVCIDGEWYNIDLTWDDSGANTTYNDGIRYRFYNCNTAFFGNHVYMPSVFPGMYEVPVTAAETYNYYKYYGLYVTGTEVADAETFKKFLKTGIEKCSERGDYLLQFAFDSGETRSMFLQYLSDYQDTVAESCSDGRSIYKVAGGYVSVSGSPYNVYFPMLRIYADTYEVAYSEAGAELAFHIVKGRREIPEEGNYTIMYHNNTAPGTAKAVLSGEGSYAGIVDAAFEFEITGGVLIPTLTPTVTPAEEPTATPTTEPTEEPTATPTEEPTITPTEVPTEEPTVTPTEGPTIIPTEEPTAIPTATPTATPTEEPTITPTEEPTIIPTEEPTIIPTEEPTATPTEEPTATPTEAPTIIPTEEPTATPTEAPTPFLTAVPTSVPELSGTPTPTEGVKATATPSVINPVITKAPVKPGKAAGLKLTSANASSVKITYRKQQNAKGYQILLFKGGKKIKSAVTTSTTHTFKKLSPSTTYTVKVCAYAEKKNPATYGSYSKTLKVTTATKTPVIKSVKAGKGKADIYWKKTSGAKGYEVYLSTKKKSGYKKAAVLKKSSAVKYTKKKLISGKTYYFKIRTYRIAGGKKIYSSYSKIKPVKL